ncbi:MAG TPA: LysR family transcriptional regulator [Usitatibacter sp.]|nr:LysR family transcriptional regulator [Usitatibacter sp.]
METFVQIVDKGSLTAAADALDTSLPSVVRVLASLERHLQVRLLNRTTRRMHLTDEGARFLERCRAILSQVREAEAALGSRGGEPQGKLAITAPVVFGRRYITPIVNAFVRRYPKVNIDLLLVDRFTNLVEEGLDVAVRVGELPDSSLVAVPVGQARRVICASPDYLRRQGKPRAPQDVAAHRCVRFTGVAPRDEWDFRMGRREVAIPITSVISCNQIDSALQACIDGLGLGMFFSYQVASHRKAGELKYVLEKFEAEPRPIQVIFPHSKLLSAKVRTFVDECVAQLRSVRFE